jgi:hypothetical protein
MLFSKKQKSNDPWEKNSFVPYSKIRIQSTIVPTVYFRSYNEWAKYIHYSNLKNKFSRLV